MVSRQRLWDWVAEQEADRRARQILTAALRSMDFSANTSQLQ